MIALCCANREGETLVNPCSIPDRGVEPTTSPPRARFTAVFGAPTYEEEEISPVPPCVSFKDEPLAKDKAYRPPPIHVRLRWRKAAIWVTVACIAVSLTFTIASSVTSAKYGSDSAFANALDCFLALCASSVLLWRFRDEKNGKFGLKRERRCCLVFGVMFVICGMLTGGSSIAHIAAKDRPEKTLSLIYVLSLAVGAYALLGVLQLHISRKLKSPAMLASAIDSALSTVLIFGLLLGNFIFNAEGADVWYLDHAVALAVAVFTFLCGAKMLVDVLIYKRLPFESV